MEISQIFIYDKSYNDSHSLKSIVDDLFLKTTFSTNQNEIFENLLNNDNVAVFLDLNSLRISQFELIELIQGLKTIRHVPIYFQLSEEFLTSFSADFCLDLLKLCSGKLGFISKPYHSRSIEYKIKQLLLN